MIPSDTVFSLRYVDRSKSPPVDNWYYLDNNFKQIASESISGILFDSRKRPWYEGAVKTEALYWTGLYTFWPSIEQGISITHPIYNPDHQLIGSVGADLTFSLLSQFLSNQKIGKTGKAFILDKSGQVIVPNLTEAFIGSMHITHELVSEVYSHFLENPERPDYILKSEGVEYIAYITKLPVIFGSEWLIMTVAPLDDFFGKMIKMQQMVIGIILGVLAISGIIIAYFAKRISSPIVTLSEEINKISSLEMKSDVRVFSNIKEINQIDNAISAMRHVISSFVKYVPKEIVRDLFTKKEEIVIGGQKREVTIFSQILKGLRRLLNLILLMS